jgi:hypothetical protein
MQLIKEKKQELQNYKRDTALPRSVLQRRSRFQDG